MHPNGHEEPNICIRCGYCCLEIQCAVSEKMYGEKRTCPALIHDSRDYSCLLANQFAPELFIGEGCDSKLNPIRVAKIRAPLPPLKV